MSEVVLYSTPRCHLCAEARAALVALGVAFREVDATDDAERFLRTPVVERDGVVIAEGKIDPNQLRRALRQRRFRRSGHA